MQPEDYESKIESEIDLYDSDRVALNQVASTLSASVGTRRNLEGFRQEILDRFYTAGFLVDVRVFEGEVEGRPEKIYFFKAVITGRTETEQEFDHDRQRHEVQANIIGAPGQEESSAPTRVAMGGAGLETTKTKSGLIIPKH